MCFALLFFMISFNLFIPELNDFVTSLGGENQKGLIFILFGITAGVSRPFSGKLSDTIGRKKVMYIGIIIGFAVTVLYPYSAGARVFFLLRLMHGFSAGFLPTGATALVTDLLPPKKRGVAMGIWGTFISVGFGTGNFFSGMIMKMIGLHGMFFVAAGFCLMACLMISLLSETLPQPRRFKWAFLKIKWTDVFEPTVRPASFVMFCSAISTGMVFVTSSDISKYLNIENKGWFFVFYMSSTILVRLFASSLSDKIGRRKGVILGLSLMVIAMIVTGTSSEIIQYTIGAIIFGLSTGVSSPTLFAWTADLSPENRRGVGAGTLFIALEFAIIFGSVLTLIFYDNSLSSIPLLYGIGSGFSILGVLYLIWHIRNFESKT
ncbi:MAG: MFS transporter [Crocinitomicaceae bacterium]|nr:MFS transporter [Crocinitomicaceae bacterium]